MVAQPSLSSPNQCRVVLGVALVEEFCALGAYEEVALPMEPCLVRESTGNAHVVACRAPRVHGA